MQKFLNKIRSVPIIIEKTNSGKRLIIKSKKFKPHIRPETIQPMGIVTIPQRIPKNISACFSFFTTPKAKGIVNEITQPIIEEVMYALKLPMPSVTHSCLARVTPPISFAKRQAGIIDGSTLNTS